ARGDPQAARVDRLLRPGVPQPPDRRDPLAAYGDVPFEPRVAGSVDDPSAAQHDVVERALGGRPRRGPRRRGRGEADQDAENQDERRATCLHESLSSAITGPATTSTWRPRSRYLSAASSI